MLFASLNPDQLRELLVFESRLEAAGWDLSLVKEMLREGTSVCPEGSADLSRGERELSIDLDIERNELLLTIEDATRRRQFVIIPSVSVEPTLDWLVGCQEEIDPHNFAPLLRNLIPRVAAVYFIDDKGTRLHLALDVPVPD